MFFLAVAATPGNSQPKAEIPIDATTVPSLLEKSEHRQVFDEAVHILGGNVNVISQWIGPVRLAVIGNVAGEQSIGGDNTAAIDDKRGSAADYAHSVIGEIAVLTGLILDTATDSYMNAETYLAAINRSRKFTLSDCLNDQDSRCANFFVVFAELEEMEAIARAIPMRPVYQKAFANPDAIRCFFSPFQTGYLEIRQALVFVRNDLTREMIFTCLQEEIYQSFGMFNDYTNSKYYSFNNRIEPKAITRYDRALLATIYDPEFGPGAPVFAVVKRLMERLGLDPFVEE